MKPLTYRDAGVDIEAGDEAVRRIAPLARTTFRPEVLGGIGAFAGFVRVPAGYREPVLVSSPGGVGAKLKVAFLADRHDTVGIDLVAMGVNDLLVHGAEPLFFLDYIGIGKLDPARVDALVGGVAAGCRRAGCALIGGETSELPDIYAPREYDLAGFAVGVVERERIVDGSAVKPGDAVLGLASSGLHSNGYTLARRIVFDWLKLDVGARLPGTGRSVGDELLEPTRIYASAVRALLAAVPVSAMANVTGGGLTGNVPRVLPDGCRVVLRRGAWREPPVFATLREAGRVSEPEMLRTFNLGVGYVVIVRAADADRRVIMAEGVESYDRLSVAMGSVVASFGVPGVEEHALGYKWLEDGVVLRDHILDAAEHADHEPDPAVRRRMLTVCVVGGGYTGVELIAELQDFFHRYIVPRYRGIDPGDYRLLLLEAGHEILRGVHPTLAERARRKLGREGIEIRTGTRVTRVEPGAVEVGGGEQVPVGLTVWAAGVIGHPVLAPVPAERDRLGRLVTRPTMQLKEHPEVYGAGDAVTIEDKDRKS